MNLSKLTVTTLLLASIGLAGCAGTPADSDDAVASEDALMEPAAATKVLEAKLYRGPNATPSPYCDEHTAVTVLKTTRGKLILELENRVVGGCEMFVEPDKRTYPLEQSEESCGSTIYKGAVGDDSVSLQDNRTRLCEDLRPAVLEFSQNWAGARRQLYGKPMVSR